MRRLLVTVILILFSVVNLLSETDDKKYIEKGNMGILISLFNNSNGFDISSYNAGVGYQVFFTDNLAFRTSIGFDSEKDYQADTILFERNSFTFRPGVRYNFSSNASVIGYFGLDLDIDYNYVSYSNPENSETENLNYGFYLYLGAEWFINDGISISPEYNFGINKSTEDVLNNETIVIEESESININTELRVNFTLYFD